MVLLGNYNALVQKNDIVYILGDICHHMPVEQANELIGKMKGKKIFVKGNHDKIYDTNLFDEVCDFKTISLNGVYLALMHYPMLLWTKKNNGSIQLHGHIHSDEMYNMENKIVGIRKYDASVAANGFYPVSVKQSIEFFEGT